MGTVRFGLYTADLNNAELRRGQDLVPLQNLPFRILGLLLREPGRLVSRDEIRQELWSADTFVDFERGISTAVSKLREAIGDSAANPRFIQTVGRRGYRFIAPVSVAAVANAPVAPPPRSDQVSSFATVPPILPANPTPRFRPTRKILLVLSGALVIAFVVGVLVWERARPSGTGNVASIAVLPFENLSGDPQQEYLTDGLTDAVITGLAQIDGLRVISRTSSMHYKHTQKTTPEIARELGVDALVEGSVSRSGNQIRLNVQLIQTKNDRHLWANAYDRELANVLNLQGELAHEIAGQIQLHVNPEDEKRLATKQRVDPETYMLYLQGRFYWHQREEQALTKAIAYFQQAVARDPNFAPAYAGLADSYVVLPFFSPNAIQPLYAKAQEAAEKALAIDPGLAEAHNSEAYVRVYRDRDFEGAEREFKKTLAINPNYATAHQWYSEMLSLEGRHEEAIEHIGQALILDPQSSVMHHQAGQIFRAARQYPRALQEFETSLQLDPQFWQNYFGIYRVYREQHDYGKAIEIGQRHATYINKAYEEAFARAAAAYRVHGTEAFLRESQKTWSTVGWPTTGYYEAWDCAELGDSNATMRILEREYTKRNPLVLGTYSDPELDGMRSDPRFQAFVKKVGFQSLTNPQPR